MCWLHCLICFIFKGGELKEIFKMILNYVELLCSRHPQRWPHHECWREQEGRTRGVGMPHESTPRPELQQGHLSRWPLSLLLIWKFKSLNIFRPKQQLLPAPLLRLLGPQLYGHLHLSPLLLGCLPYLLGPLIHGCPHLGPPSLTTPCPPTWPPTACLTTQPTGLGTFTVMGKRSEWIRYHPWTIIPPVRTLMTTPKNPQTPAWCAGIPWGSTTARWPGTTDGWGETEPES